MKNHYTFFVVRHVMEMFNNFYDVKTLRYWMCLYNLILLLKQTAILSEVFLFIGIILSIFNQSKILRGDSVKPV